MGAHCKSWTPDSVGPLPDQRKDGGGKLGWGRLSLMVKVPAGCKGIFQWTQNWLLRVGLEVSAMNGIRFSGASPIFCQQDREKQGEIEPSASFYQRGN